MTEITAPVALGVIGGSGLYALAGLREARRHRVQTPFGEPSGQIVVGVLGAQRMVFLARHGEDHRLAPHRVNYRANVWALHQLGVRHLVAVNAVGGIRADLGPRSIVVPDQLIDYTWGRTSSFHDVEGAKVEHIDFSAPYAAPLRRQLLAAAAEAGVAAVDGGSYGVTQGPRLETRAEIARLRREGCDLVGMTGMPEAVLARELGVDYACLALVANFAAGCGGQAEISVAEIFANLESATSHVPAILAALAVV
jgi:5'-methylthioinosine phosphorylase